jgi:NAD(P)-dependent dehydrogenase (short-subunit alcohol dehydrogenase family)
MDLQLTGRTALVTGGTGGIGHAIARRLAAEGATVFVTGRSRDRLDEVASASGGSIRGIVGDPSSAAGAEAIVAELPVVDILINNLGAYESKDFFDISDDDWLDLFQVNVLSGMRLSRAYLPHMLTRDWGRVLFIVSEAGLAIPPDMVHYGATKAAQLGLARGLAKLTRGTAVTVNSVLPGPTRSDGLETFLRSQAADPNAPLDRIEQEFFESARPASIIQRLINADEVANLVAYLASPLSSATNGAAMRAEGGLIDTIA